MDAEKYPNQRSTHSCGIIISEEPITNFTALEIPKGFPIVQFDMHVAEDIGFEKIDILSHGLGNTDEAVKIIEKTVELKWISRIICHCKTNATSCQYCKTLGRIYRKSCYAVVCYV
jgi:DNA polymerase-3 subunit alpha/error-prone DNA polymerase